MQVSNLEWIEHKWLHYIDKRRTARIGCDNELIRSKSIAISLFSVYFSTYIITLHLISDNAIVSSTSAHRSVNTWGVCIEHIASCTSRWYENLIFALHTICNRTICTYLLRGNVWESIVTFTSSARHKGCSSKSSLNIQHAYLRGWWKYIGIDCYLTLLNLMNSLYCGRFYSRKRWEDVVMA